MRKEEKLKNHRKKKKYASSSRTSGTTFITTRAKRGPEEGEQERLQGNYCRAAVSGKGKETQTRGSRLKKTRSSTKQHGGGNVRIGEGGGVWEG